MGGMGFEYWKSLNGHEAVEEEKSDVDAAFHMSRPKRPVLHVRLSLYVRLSQLHRLGLCFCLDNTQHRYFLLNVRSALLPVGSKKAGARFLHVPPRAPRGACRS